MGKRTVSNEKCKKRQELYDAGLNDYQIAREMGYASSTSIQKWRKKEGLPSNFIVKEHKSCDRQRKRTLCWDCQNARADRCMKFIADVDKDWKEFGKFTKKNWEEYEQTQKVYRWETTAGEVERVWDVDIVVKCKKFIPDGKEYPEALEELKENIERLKEGK